MSNAWGRLLQWQDADRNAHQWAMPMSLLEGDASLAAQVCFTSWPEGFGGAGNREERALFEQVRAFFEAHGASRFEDWHWRGDEPQRVIHRAGFFRASSESARQYYVLPEAFKNEIAKGFNPKWAAQALLSAGWIDGGEGGRATQKPRLALHYGRHTSKPHKPLESLHYTSTRANAPHLIFCDYKKGLAHSPTWC